MNDMQADLEKLRNEAAERELISKLATNKTKKELIAKLAEHHRGPGARSRARVGCAYDRGKPAAILILNS